MIENGLQQITPNHEVEDIYLTLAEFKLDTNLGEHRCEQELWRYSGDE